MIGLFLLPIVQRRLTLRPITRDGGAHLSSARRYIEKFPNASLKESLGGSGNEKFLMAFFILICLLLQHRIGREKCELQLLKKLWKLEQTQAIYTRNLISREQIDAANIPVLFVELASGQNSHTLIQVTKW